ncbi:VOC family protein [Alteribacter populi]|uniref:VOC family protein n=1 Tax=Alteribacter populi TaxID=2011011 RepID=UPI000BBB1CD2|nr:hypothetical protein [Alteribacter populi]
MLSFQNSSPTVFLVETEKVSHHSFLNTRTGVEHSTLDFYTEDLEGCYNDLKSKRVKVGALNKNGLYGGFGFYDPDGHLLSATNVLHEGQEKFKQI